MVEIQFCRFVNPLNVKDAFSALCARESLITVFFRKRK